LVLSQTFTRCFRAPVGGHHGVTGHDKCKHVTRNEIGISYETEISSSVTKTKENNAKE